MTVGDGVALAIIQHARAEAPRECCGLLVGAGDRIVRAVPAANIAPDPTRRYLIEPRDHLTAIRLARADGLQVIGAYHSHPRSPAHPSATDAAEAFSNFIYVIVGLTIDPPEFTAWEWHDGNFAPVLLVRT